MWPACVYNRCPFYCPPRPTDSLQSDIMYDGAILNINKINKEENNMIGKLNEYLADLVEDAEKIKSEDYTAEIDAAVIEFRAKLVEDYEAKRAAALAENESNRKYITLLIERESIREVESPVVASLL